MSRCSAFWNDCMNPLERGKGLLLQVEQSQLVKRAGNLFVQHTCTHAHSCKESSCVRPCTKISRTLASTKRRLDWVWSKHEWIHSFIVVITRAWWKWRCWVTFEVHKRMEECQLLVAEEGRRSLKWSPKWSPKCFLKKSPKRRTTPSLEWRWGVGARQNPEYKFIEFFSSEDAKARQGDGGIELLTACNEFDSWTAGGEKMVEFVNVSINPLITENEINKITRISKSRQWRVWAPKTWPCSRRAGTPWKLSFSKRAWTPKKLSFSRRSWTPRKLSSLGRE